MSARSNYQDVCIVALLALLLAFVVWLVAFETAWELAQEVFPFPQSIAKGR